MKTHSQREARMTAKGRPEPFGRGRRAVASGWTAVLRLIILERRGSADNGRSRGNGSGISGRSIGFPV